MFLFISENKPYINPEIPPNKKLKPIIGDRLKRYIFYEKFKSSRIFLGTKK